jgi:phage regulator Rha-like protein
MLNDLIATNNEITMSTLDIAEVTKKQHKHVMADVRKMMESLKIQSAEFSAHYLDGKGRTYQSFNLPKRETLILVSGYSIELRAKIIDRLEELESYKAPQTKLDWIELALKQEKTLLLALSTKAEIGNRREATSMNTASQATKKANKLEAELDKAKEYSSIKRMQMAYHGQSFNWRLLKESAKEMGMPSIDIFDANYGTVKAYHKDVWLETYAVEVA